MLKPPVLYGMIVEHIEVARANFKALKFLPGSGDFCKESPYPGIECRCFWGATEPTWKRRLFFNEKWGDVFGPGDLLYTAAVQGWDHGFEGIARGLDFCDPLPNCYHPDVLLAVYDLTYEFGDEMRREFPDLYMKTLGYPCS